MTDVERLPREALIALAGQLSTRLPHVNEAVDAEGPLNIGETLPVWTLRDAEALRHPAPQTLDELAESAGYWHLQIRRGVTATLVAHATPGPSGQWDVINVTGAQLAPMVQRAISRIDRLYPQAGSAVLLIVPSRLCVAIWIRSNAGDKILVVSCDDRSAGLQPGRAFSAKYFLRRILPSSTVAAAVAVQGPAPGSGLRYR